MKRLALQTMVSAGLVLGLATLTTTACVAPPGNQAAKAGSGKFVRMDDVDDSLADKITGDRYQVTYEEGDMWKGAPNGAKVTIVEYSDFQCPYCSRLTNAINDVAEKYPDDVRVVFKHYPLAMHQRATPASEAVLAAHAQGKGWELHDVIFANNRQLSDADLENYAKQVGVPDMDKFKQDLEAHTYKAKVDADMEQGKKFGVTSTPSFFVNGVPQRGAKTPEQLEQLIQKEIELADSLIAAGSKVEEVYARIMRAAQTSRAAPQRKRADKGKKRPQQGKPDPSKNYAVPTDERPQKGADEALVTIIEYSDFECPYCRRVLPTLDQIEEEYGDKVRVVFRQQPLPMHKNAKPAALAALAAHQQGKFWEMHDALFKKAESRALNDEAYVAIAQELQLDVDKFNADRKNPELMKMIDEDQQIAGQFGVTGTPAFFVNGRPLSGAQPFESFKAVVDEELKKAEEFLADNDIEPEELYAEMAKNWETEVKRPPIADEKRREIATDTLPGKGNLDDAKITLVECSDFDCPYCTRGAKLVEQIFANDRYKDVTAFYFANFPLPMHKNAMGAHQAAVAAGNQGKFFEMHDLLFADRNKRSEADYKEMAAQLGLDVDKFMADWASEETKAKIEADKKLCAGLGVSGTPNFFVNGRSMRGAVPIQMASKVFDEELSGGFEARQKGKDEAEAKDDAKADAKDKAKDDAKAKAKGDAKGKDKAKGDANKGKDKDKAKDE